MASSQDETRRTISEFFVKSLNVILGARIPSKYLELKPKDIVMAAQDVNKGFNLVLVNSPLRNRCHLNAVEPIVVDVLLLQQCNNVAGPSENPRKQLPDIKNGMSQSLIERWVVHCVPWSSIADDSKRMEALTRKKIHKGRSSTRPPAAPQCKASEEPWSPCKKAIRMLTIMLRSLYSLTRLLPAYRLFQVLNSTADCCSFDLSYKVRTTLSASSEANEETFKKFNLTPVETELGRMCISVGYSSSASVEAIERSSSIFSDIIPDYVGSAGGLSRELSSNPADMRLAAMIRTKSDNVPLPSGKKTSVGVRRTSSSPLQATKDFDNVHDQLVCPFATDDKLENCQRMEPICGASRDAAVGALITALKLATPIRSPLNQNPVNMAAAPDGEALRSEPPLQTFKHAIQELNNYKVVSYSLSKRN